ncbi:hypothetical protein GGS26DRAFT_9110 [Hypomontagnella submonticulosa]|nr:hypothetical protein GGS26DRAFT_9110 [Hypomontagnella submonticulosa]
MDASYLPQDPPLSTKSKDASIPNHIYTANHYSDLNNYKDGLAFAATYLAGSGSSCGIIFGCTLQDIEKVEVMLEACETSWNHPLLLPCMFLELQTERLSAMADLLGTRSETTQLELENLRDQGKNDFPRGITNSLINLNKDSSTIGEGLRAAIRQLSKLISHSEALLTAQEQAGASVQSNGFLLHDTRRFIARFKEINFVYENLIASCRIDAQFTTLAADVHSNEISRRSTLMATILTFIAMVYLPATAMATILAMPIFKFDADWRDIFGHPAPTSKDDSSSAPSSTSALDSATLTASPSSSPILDVPVVSYYIWVYIGMSQPTTGTIIDDHDSIPLH